ncbi:hypothetical protein [Thauera butanivorans]|uniref:hypothetical protein n=1 Tax=Thauera butanivorans TaxID=86174 RepID=UPI000838C489|nr:hypothetical protein [Thauera butanivorans]
MNKTQADAAARAVLEPGIRAQQEARRKRHEQEFIEARRRQVSRFAFAGFGIGAALACFHFRDEYPLVVGSALMGSLAGTVLGWIVAWWRGRSRAG